MIKYKCVRCQTKLETDKLLAGKTEPCPSCGHVNRIPGGPKPKAEPKPKAPAAAKPLRVAAPASPTPHPPRLHSVTLARATMTETLLDIFGGLSMAGGLVLAVLGAVNSGGSEIAFVWSITAGVASVVTGLLLIGVATALQYLRRLVNAAEASRP